MKISEDKVPKGNEVIAHPTTSKVLINNKEIVLKHIISTGIIILN